MKKKYSNSDEAAELDPASMMFSLGKSEKRKHLIRLSVMLCEMIEPGILRAALERTAARYPFFLACITVKGNILYAKPVQNLPEIEEKKSMAVLEASKLCTSCEAWVSYRGNVIILEYSHAISDGKGGMEFLVALVAQYLSIKQQKTEISKSIFVMPIEQQVTDGYATSAKGWATAGKKGRAFQIASTPESNHPVHITSFRLSVSQVRDLSKAQKASINDYVAALLIQGLFNIQCEQKCGKKKKIRLTVPVNLRSRFACNTMHNFLLSVYPEIDPMTDSMTLPDICDKIHRYMKTATNTERLAGRCGLYSTAKLLMRLLPISLKSWVVRTSLNFPFAGSSMTFSNLGAVALPSAIKPYVLDFQMTFSDKPESPYSCSMLSLGDCMQITFLRAIEQPLLEETMEGLFHRYGICYEKIIHT